jgi:hypothetical protein
MWLGYDSIHTAIMDLKWETTTSSEMSSIMAAMVPTTSFTPDPQIESQVEFHWQLLRESLEQAKLFGTSRWNVGGQEFSRKEHWLGPSVGMTTLTTMLHIGMQAQCVLMNTGLIQGKETYENHSFFMWSNLKAEYKTIEQFSLQGKTHFGTPKPWSKCQQEFCSSKKWGKLVSNHNGADD